MIRKARGQDWEALVSLFIIENKHNAALAPDTVRETTEVLTVEELDAILGDDNSALFVAEHNDTVVGALLGNVVQVACKRWTAPRGYSYIEDIVVAPRARRQGIAQKLVAHFECWARAKKATSVELHVWPNNADAIRCYAKMGFINKQLLLSKRID